MQLIFLLQSRFYFSLLINSERVDNSITINY